MFLWGLQKNGATGSTSNSNAGSLFLWRNVASQKKVEEAQQRLAEKQRGTVKEAHRKRAEDANLTRAMGGMPNIKAILNEAPAAPKDDVSECSTTCPSDDEGNDLKPLLWVSEPRFEEGSTRQFVVMIGRSSTDQRFGLTFSAKSDGKIIVAEDAQQFGIAKGDVVLGINGRSQSLTVEYCMRVLKSSLKIELSLLRISHESQLKQGKPLTGPISQRSLRSNRQGVMCVDLLAVSPQQPLPSGLGDQFTVRISRATCHVKFGLNLRSVNSDPTGHCLTSAIYCAEDMPHLGLKKDDKIVSLNGRAVTNYTECQHLFDTSMSVELSLERRSEEPSIYEEILFEQYIDQMEFEITESEDEESYNVEATVEDVWVVPFDDDEPHVCVPKKSII